jgi:hypothetical protein
MTDTNLWVEVAKQVPALAVLVGLVVYFIRHLRDGSTDTRAVIDRLTADHREEMQAARASSKELAESGHNAVNNLAASFQELKLELQRHRLVMEHAFETASGSEIFKRRRTGDPESVHY